MRVALVSCVDPPHPDEDEATLVDALTRRGVTASVMGWDDPGVAWRSFDRAVVRSTWNYYRAPEAFQAWARAAGAQVDLRNRAETLAWNGDKAYLARLAEAGAPVVPTRLIPRGSTIDLAALATDAGWSRVVVKPRISAGSFETYRFDVAALRGGELTRCAAERDVLVQPYLPSVERYGERALVWLRGELTHAVRKSARFRGDAEHTERVPIADDERACAAEILALVAEPLLYARVDLARDADGRPTLMELELIEPSLFLRFSPEATERFADAIARA